MEDQAELFLQVVRSQGFSAAAKAVGKSVSTLSRAVQELEEALGAQLLVRTTRRLHLTDAGAVFASHVEAMLSARRAAFDAVAEMTGERPRGMLRVSMPVSVGERLLGRHLPAFRRKYPDLRLEIDLSDRNVALVEGGFDLAIRVGRPHDSSLRAVLLGRVSVCLVASPRYLDQHGAPKKPEDLAAHRCLTVGPISSTQEWTLFKGARREVIPVRSEIHSTSPTLSAQLAVSGLGIMRTTEWIIRDELKKGQLVPVLPDWSCDHPQKGGVPVFAMFAQNASAAPPLKARVFVELVKNVMATEVL